MRRKQNVQHPAAHTKEYKYAKANQVRGIWTLTILSETAVAALALFLTFGILPGTFPDLNSLFQKQDEPVTRQVTEAADPEETDYGDYGTNAEEVREAEPTPETSAEPAEETASETSENTAPERTAEPETAEPSETEESPETEESVEPAESYETAETPEPVYEEPSEGEEDFSDDPVSETEESAHNDHTAEEDE